MTEISLLMTGVLRIKLPVLPHFPEQQQIHRENKGQQSIHSHTKELNPIAQIKPPEFVQTDEISPVQVSLLAFRTQDILQRIHQQQLFEPPSTTPIDQEALDQNPQAMPTLSFGTSGISVRILQRLLIANGYGIQTDGVFGPLTETAVKAFQSQRRLLTDGVAGQKTWGELSK
jgi:murein L,D-transpeptidase YcbB/YkuD